MVSRGCCITVMKSQIPLWRCAFVTSLSLKEARSSIGADGATRPLVAPTPLACHPPPRRGSDGGSEVPWPLWPTLLLNLFKNLESSEFIITTTANFDTDSSR